MCVAESVVCLLCVSCFLFGLQCYRKHTMRIGAKALVAFFVSVLLGSTAVADGKY